MLGSALAQQCFCSALSELFMLGAERGLHERSPPLALPSLDAFQMQCCSTPLQELPAEDNIHTAKASRHLLDTFQAAELLNNLLSGGVL